MHKVCSPALSLLPLQQLGQLGQGPLSTPGAWAVGQASLFTRALPDASVEGGDALGETQVRHRELMVTGSALKAQTRVRADLPLGSLQWSPPSSFPLFPTSLDLLQVGWESLRGHRAPERGAGGRV